MNPISINFHLYKPCDSRCTFCFATFRDVEGQLDPDDARRLLDRLRAAGGEKLTFAGGEPTLHPHLGALVDHAKALGFTTSVVTSGSRLDALLDGHASSIDWVALSIDSAVERVQRSLGRGRGDHVARVRVLASRCRNEGVRLKVNTVVTALNCDEEMGDLLRELRPERWKVFQVLRVEGQNDGRVEPLLIPREHFVAFVERHASLGSSGIEVVAEDNDAMEDSYVMIDPRGRFYGNHGGRHQVSDPILGVGVRAALDQVGFSIDKFEGRGGRYAW
ncbi:MAG: viperin family antiviral radical SAM protein [Deltaproteobacteria bacterium]|nr:viperin family antiviral radical SAM protein [Myxococcales bacterium]MDP3220379.1 viperin family antiviral radical SAM protein [Deltaproteobacteria bacterium]